ncbi:proton-coupled folate transporter [Elysia marginata]|uniref:Proton-coupled folate transporter n=1 Tax=Elysia marginata TaxID=1093978 RepID=A0AAV4FNR3_9GAST|nr:proton-coupled folate transporter [Elysia marginata]
MSEHDGAEVPESDEETEESTSLLPGGQGQGHYGEGHKRAFPFLRARVLAILVPMLLSSAFVSRESLLAQYLVERLGRDENKTHTHVNPCHSDLNSSAVKNADELESEAADLISQFALFQTIPAFFACLVFGSYSDFLGRRLLLLVPVFTGVFKLLMTSLIIGFHLSLNYMYLAYAVDGLSGSWFTILIALYSVTADINTGRKSRTFSIFLIMCLSSTSTAGVSIASSDLISSLGFFDASLLITSIGAVAFIIPLVLFPETLHCQRPQIFNTQTEDEQYQEQPGRAESPPLLPAVETHPTLSEPPAGHERDWVNPVTQLRRLFGFYLFDGTARQRAEMILLLLVFMFTAANEINQGSIDALYQLHRPFCWGPKQIGYYNAIRAGGSNIFGGLWLFLLKKCLPFEVIGIVGVTFQGVALAYEAFVVASWQFYISALFSSIAVVETLCNLASTPSYNKVYSLTLGSSTPGAVYLLMASCSGAAVLLFM